MHRRQAQQILESADLGLVDSLLATAMAMVIGKSQTVKYLLLDGCVWCCVGTDLCNLQGSLRAA